MSHTITLKDVSPVTHDTHRYLFDRPEGLEFEPGQAAELALMEDGWRDEGRPFTFVSDPDSDDLAFVIKSYPDHDGLTEQLPKLKPGAQMTLDGPFGAITDHGPGVFIAAGAGVTPFIPILRQRDRAGALEGCALLYGNKTARDIILRDEWEGMADLKTTFAVSDEAAEGLHHGQIDRDLLSQHTGEENRHFYICGPQGFVDDMRDGLKALGIEADRIITEEGW